MDALAKEYPGVIVRKGEHNHPMMLSRAGSLHHGDPDSQNMEACDNTQPVSSRLPSLTKADEIKLQTLLNRIEEGLSSKPAVFVPALKKMLRNADRFAATESGLVSAMLNFGSYSGVQPTAPGQRKSLLSGRRKLNVGRPAGIRKPATELSQVLVHCLKERGKLYTI